MRFETLRENHAKLKESVPEKKTDDRIDEILKAMAPLVKQAQTPTVTAYESYDNSQNPTRAQRENPPISTTQIRYCLNRFTANTRNITAHEQQPD